jgi:signal transduction histidine kinase
MLAGIIGLSEMLELDEQNSEIAKDLKMITTTAWRAKDLSQKLLAFARKGKNINKAVNMNEVINEVIELLKRTINMNIHIISNTQPDLFTIDADPTQMNQVLMNLSMNAIEAMPNGGILTIETRNLQKNVPSQSGEDIERFVEISVSDTGIGIPEEVQKHLFEPFFTTKNDPKKEGTGLGLAMVYGIVKNHGGTIDYKTEGGKGTTFIINLPINI